MTTADQPQAPATGATTTTVPAGTIRRRANAERLAYAACAAGIAIGPQCDQGPLSYLGAIGTAAGTGLWLYCKATPKDGAAPGMGLLRSALRALPALTGSALYAAALAAPGTAWWEIAGPALWGAAAAAAAPFTRSAGLTEEALPDLVAALPPQDVPAQDAPHDYPSFLARLWDQAELAPGTKLTAVEHFQPGLPDFRAVIVAQPGKAVPQLSLRNLAAAFDVPEEAVTFTSLLGSGPGRMVLSVTPTVGETTRAFNSLEALWESAVTDPGGAAPGVKFVRARIENDRIVILAAAPRGKKIRLPHSEVCSALGVDDPTRLVIETDGLRQAVVSVYRTNPLMNVRKATVADLTMDERGRVAVGVCHDGRPAVMRLWDPGQGALRGIVAGVTGAGKSVLLNLILAAEKRSGVVSWVADIQGGMSLPEADGRVDWFAKGEDEALTMLVTAHKVMKYREKISNEMGRGDFAIGCPWPLINITLDEINRLLSHPDEKKKKLAAYLIADIQKTGRKVGIGIRLAVQSLHLKDLGDEEAIRQQGKVGVLFLMRTASSSTRDMGLDGVAPPGFQLENIPARIYETGQIEALFHGTDDDEGQSTAGMAYMFLDGRASFMRTFYAEKKNGIYPDLIELYGEEPPATITDGEADAAGKAYALRNEPPAAPAPDGVPVADADHGPVPDTDPAAMPELPAVPSFDPPAADSAVDLTKEFESGPTLRERILDLLADGPMSLPEMRKVLCPEYKTGSVNTEVGELKRDGWLESVGRGAYQLVTEPADA
ncbi:hypothetical protein [Kitasatospora sp. NPDC006786]|uniref:hypothetical protein n=1 Tax=unclassified Kitasatospora TaxID=2633591 RepID=UPI0033D5DDCB